MTGGKGQQPKARSGLRLLPGFARTAGRQDGFLMRRLFIRLMTVAATLVLAAVAAGGGYAPLVNGNFETGDLSGWTTSVSGGAAQVQTTGDDGTNGTHFAVVAAGDVNVWQSIQQEIVVQPGDKITLEAAFYGAETQTAACSLGYKDEGEVIVSEGGSQTVLYSTDACATHGFGGWQTFSYTATGNDVLTFVARVENVGSSQNASEIFLDNVTDVPAAPTITSGPSGTVQPPNVTLTFTGDAGNTFLCALDGSSYSACTSPQSYSGLDKGKHTFAVKQVGTNGTSAAATRSWGIPIPGRTAYCSVAGNFNPDTLQTIKPGTFLDLQTNQPLWDPNYTGATAALYVQGEGLTCGLPNGYVQHGYVGAAGKAEAVGYPYYVKSWNAPVFVDTKAL